MCVCVWYLSGIQSPELHVYIVGKHREKVSSWSSGWSLPQTAMSDLELFI